MFTILIVEDDMEKLRNILTTIETIPEINVDMIDHEVDSMGAKKALKAKFYDLLILDIAIPLRKSEQIDMQGGIKLLQEIRLRDAFKIPSHIIGLTALDEIFSHAAKEFESHVLSVIRYSDIDIEWQSQLRLGIQQRVSSKNSSDQDDPKFDYDIAIITAVETEFAAVKALCKNWRKVTVQSDASPYIETIFTDEQKSFRVVASCASQMGMNAAAVLSMKLIHNFRPRYLFMTGIAASVKGLNDHGFGDVIVIDESWDGGAGKIVQDNDGNNKFQPTAQHLRLNKDISEKMRNIKDDQDLLRAIKDKWKPNQCPNTELAVHIGSVVSVAGVIENPAVIGELKHKDRKLIGLEMEAHGMYYSSYNCSNPKPIAIALKSISDFANENKNDQYQAYAAYTSASVMYNFIMKELS